MKKIYLLTTEHLKKGLWFRDDEDFRVAMNFVAIQAASSPEVGVLAFLLMSNHVHFVLVGTKDSVEAFVNGLKHRYSIYYRRRYGVKEFLQRNCLDIRTIPYDDEAPEKAIAYVQMNCVAANICGHPSQYVWGTGNSFFNPSPKVGKPLGEFSGRARKKLMHSEFDLLPEDWLICSEGFIIPASYVDVKAVEKLFRTPKRMNYFLVNSSKAKKRLEADENLPSFRDQTILAALPDLCRGLFQKDAFFQLRPDEQSEFVRQIRFRFSADATQIARVCGITYAEAARLLDDI